MTRRPLLLLAAILLALLVAGFVLWLWVNILRGLAGTSTPVGQGAERTPKAAESAAPSAASRDLARPVLPASPDPAADQPAARAAQGPSVVAGEGATLGPSIWDRLAFCESRGEWHINTGNGYYGGLQENMDFWRSYGDPQYARPDLAPKSAQIAAAVKARDGGRGYEPWPVCSVKVGLR